MICTGSRFFDKFSLRKLLEDNYPWVRTAPSGAGGSIGGGSGFVGAGKSSYRKSENYSCPVHLIGDDRFDEPGFIASLRSLIESEILACQAAILANGNLGQNGFYFEYKWEDISGRIDILGKLIVRNYVLNAEIHETGLGDRHLAYTAFLDIQPQGDYHVIGVKEENSSDQEIIETGRRMIEASVPRMRAMSKDQLRDLPYAEVFTLIRLPPDIRRALEVQQIRMNVESNFDLPEEYGGYEKIYFLNETALRMYRDAGMKLEVLKKVSAAEMPAECHRTLRGPYPL